MEKIKKVALVGLELGTMAFWGASSVLAQQGPINIPGEVTTLPSFSVAAFVTNIIRLIIIIAFVVAFVFLLIGGIRWIIAGGETKAVEGARNMVTGALVGLIIVLAAFAIIRLIEFFFNVKIISGEITLPQIPTGT